MRKETVAPNDGTRTVYTYDDAGNQIRMTDYAPNGQVICDCFYQNNASGKVVAWKVFDGAGVMLRRFEVDYDAQGLEAECREFDSGGNLLRRTLAFYDSVGHRLGEQFDDSRCIY
jgi:antitoxin component YwqK of YwqJK toxin-antitoxin module